MRVGSIEPAIKPFEAMQFDTHAYIRTTVVFASVWLHVEILQISSGENFENADDCPGDAQTHAVLGTDV